MAMGVGCPKKRNKTQNPIKLDKTQKNHPGLAFLKKRVFLNPVLYVLEVFILAHYGPPSTETPTTETTIVRCHKNS